MDSTFRPLSLLRAPNPFKTASLEKEFWSSFKKPFFTKEFLPVTCLHYSPSPPHELLVTNTNRIQIYDSTSCTLQRTINSIKNTPHGAIFREDGKLLLAGDDAGCIHIFEVSSKSELRKLTGHSQPVHRAMFSSEGSQVFSYSDDKSVRVWDLSSGEQLSSLEGHTDYIRSGAVSASSPHLCVSGSYDHTVRLWDTREGECTMILEHGSPVESVLVFPSGGLMLSAGGNYVKVWDIRSGGFLKEFSNHHKTVTQLTLSADGRRLFTGSLDGQLKIYDVTDYSVMHAISYPAPILCLAFSPTQRQISVGMSSGLLSVKTKEETEQTPHTPRPPQRGAFRYFLRGKSIKPTSEVVLISNKSKKRRPTYDVYLRKFKYKLALDAAFENVGTLRPTIIMSMFKELSRRNGLEIALGGRNEEELLPIIKFITRNIIHPKFSAYLIEICNLLIEIYPDMLNQAPKICAEIKKIKTKITNEVRFHKEVFQTIDALEVILSNSN